MTRDHLSGYVMYVFFDCHVFISRSQRLNCRKKLATRNDHNRFDSPAQGGIG